MYLRELELDEFRSYHKLRLTIDPPGFRLIGPNASGKSTVLEAIAMLATTRSPRTSAEREIAHWRSGEDLSVPPYARVRGEVERVDGVHTIEIGLTLEAHGTGALKKQLRLDERAARAVDVVGEVKTVLFSPDDVDLIAGSPGGRRRYLDVAISQASRLYLRALSRYSRVLEQRNSLLRQFARERLLSNSPRQAEELAFWDSELIASAVDVLAIRLGAVRKLSDQAKIHFAALTGDDAFAVVYLPNRVRQVIDEMASPNWQSPPQAHRQMISAALTEALGSWRAEELRRGATAIGPHRDDFAVMMNGIDLGRYGSRGQQRLALIALKLAELDLLHESAGEPPILLLDDILSELDAQFRANVVSMLASRDAQICVTATEVEDLASPRLRHLPLWRSQRGAVETNHQRLE
jgi:DNA replication and repair protein RecF